MGFCDWSVTVHIVSIHNIKFLLHNIKFLQRNSLVARAAYLLNIQNKWILLDSQLYDDTIWKQAVKQEIAIPLWPNAVRWSGRRHSGMYQRNVNEIWKYRIGFSSKNKKEELILFQSIAKYRAIDHRAYYAIHTPIGGRWLLVHEAMSQKCSNHNKIFQKCDYKLQRSNNVVSCSDVILTFL